jgi:hypothetical protein
MEEGGDLTYAEEGKDFPVALSHPSEFDYIIYIICKRSVHGQLFRYVRP